MSDEYVIAEKRRKVRSWLIVLGVIVFVALVAVMKNLFEGSVLSINKPVSSRYAELRAASSPLVVFFHSPACSSCKQVKAALDEVYPEFADKVSLLDVDVSNMRDRELVERAGVQTAPTLLVVDAAGNEQLIVGEISPQNLRTVFKTLAGGTP